MEAIDWRVAQRVGEMLAGNPPVPAPGAAMDGQSSATASGQSHGGSTQPPGTGAGIQPLAERFAEQVAAYSGLDPSGALPAIELVDRPRWIEANIATMRPMLAPLGNRLGQGSGPMAAAMRSFTAMLLGAQIGAVTGMLSQRVLGQYDIALLDDAVAPRLLLVAPNLAQAARNMALDRDQLTEWVAIHEVAHAVQFGGAPWLREHLAAMLRELIASMDVRVSAGRSLRLPDMDDLRGLVERLRRAELLRITLGERRWGLVEAMQATMSLVEGHAEHVMDAVGAQVLPSLPQMRAAMTRRRRDRTWPWRILERLLGMELKLRQYEVGRRFCDQVVAQAGPGGLSLVWSSADALPSTAELERPALWLRRVGLSDGAASVA
jgi:coenzyme F420 biosynthesis associated uncharacterized protein